MTDKTPNPCYAKAAMLKERCKTMTKSTATSILKLSAILIVFLGLILFSQVLCQIRTINGATFKPLQHAYYFPVVVALWGIVLYLLSTILGSMIAGNNQ